MQRYIVILLMLGAIWPHWAGAGAWSQAKGRYYAKVSGIFYTSDEVFDDMGDRAPAGMDGNKFESDQAFLYLEYGLRERLTLIGKVSGGELVVEDDFVKQTTIGIGDLDMGAKYQLTNGPVVLAPYLNFKIPTGYHGDYEPALGTDYTDLELRLLAAHSLYPWPFYLGAETGYRFRGGPYSNQIPYFFEVGATPHKRVFAKAYLEGMDTLTGEDESAGEVGILQVSEGDFTKMGLNVAFKLQGPVWADLLWEGIVSGKNIGAGSSWGLGISYILKEFTQEVEHEKTE